MITGSCQFIYVYHLFLIYCSVIVAGQHKWHYDAQTRVLTPSALSKTAFVTNGIANGKLLPVSNIDVIVWLYLPLCRILLTCYSWILRSGVDPRFWFLNEYLCRAIDRKLATCFLHVLLENHNLTLYRPNNVQSSQMSLSISEIIILILSWDMPVYARVSLPDFEFDKDVFITHDHHQSAPVWIQTRLSYPARLFMV